MKINNKLKIIYISIVILLLFIIVSYSEKNPVPIYSYKIINTYPHDRNAFTQGLVFENGFLYEGTGLYGKSSLRKTALETGEVLQIHRVPDQFFGEGITIYENKIIQLTWKSKIGFVYDKDTFNLLKTFEYMTEGWGITHDGRQLIMSDGTATLYFLHPETFNETHRIEVSESGSPVSNINELEYIRGEIYANVWQTDYIIRIDTETGNVIEKINLKGIMKFNQPVDVLNGIAYNAESETLLVTGKLWPRIFEIRLVEK